VQGEEQHAHGQRPLQAHAAQHGHGSLLLRRRLLQLPGRWLRAAATPAAAIRPGPALAGAPTAVASVAAGCAAVSGWHAPGRMADDSVVSLHAVRAGGRLHRLQPGCRASADRGLLGGWPDARGRRAAERMDG
jgi:hypothetical protein